MQQFKRIDVSGSAEHQLGDNNEVTTSSKNAIDGFVLSGLLVSPEPMLKMKVSAFALTVDFGREAW